MGAVRRSAIPMKEFGRESSRSKMKRDGLEHTPKRKMRKVKSNA